ncbi:hypothetical protein AB5J72_00285 [Streptomyces sp. CG1]|uniref:hypothetical protein n=1 Tax=Streptomyces sp. CG1 TaxID=1287523 RepID=UPI0034E22DA3
MPRKLIASGLGRTTCTLLAALAVAAASLLTSSGTASASAADDSGMVCMFLAPDATAVPGGHASHVGWAYRWADGSQWDYGATVDNGNWRLHGPLDKMLRDFKNDTMDHYTEYRCRLTRGHDQAAASQKADELYGQPYRFLWNNCLTRSIAIMKAYDTSGELNTI